MKKSAIFILILFFMSSLSLNQSTMAQTQVNYTIIYDEAHLQFFTHELMSMALSGLNETFDSSSKDVTIQLVINKENFTSSNLQGSDLVIITNPGLKDGSADYIINDDSNEDEEKNLLGYINDGGSVLYMGNPVSNNDSIRGHRSAMDRLVIDELGANLRLGSGDGDNTTVVIDDFRNDGNSSHVYFTNDHIQYDIWKTETNEVSSVLYYGSSLDQPVAQPFFGNGTELTYAVGPDYSIIIEDNGEVVWLSGSSSIGSNGGRALLIGSTIMFSDYSYNESMSWNEVEDNNLLFQNLVAWSLKMTPLNVPEETVDSGFGYFLSRNIFLSILIPIALIVLIFSILLKNNIITIDKIMEFRTKKKETPQDKSLKKTTKSTKKTTKKGAKKTTKKRRKRN
jgi:hypothetical protein